MNQNRKVMAYTKLIVEKQDNICTVKINNPEALNALNSTILKELDAAFTAIGEDDSVDVVILTGEGRSFVAGADISHGKTGRWSSGHPTSILSLPSFSYCLHFPNL